MAHCSSGLDRLDLIEANRIICDLLKLTATASEWPIICQKNAQYNTGFYELETLPVAHSTP